jgi:HD-GYP domain-containing protein (c-di-GMP phosphodiesterase class II)
MSLGDVIRREAFYTSLLKDCGCSDNSARVHKIFGGDDLLAKRAVKVVDWSNTLESMKYALAHLEPGGTIGQKLRKVPALLGPPHMVMDRLTQARCTRAASIARQLGFSPDVCTALSNLDEHWDGKGSPRHLKKTAVPILARIVGLAQTVDVFVCTFGLDDAFEMLERRNGKWFDPDVVKAALSLRNDREFWSEHTRALNDPSFRLPDVEDPDPASSATVDQICEAFAEIIDAKSSFTAEHSSRVAAYAVELGQHFGFTPTRITTLRRAALLHDVGKLGVSNMILDKPDRLTEDEFQLVKLHPMFSHEILARIPGFERITEIASAHHEKLNGRGYWRGLSGDQLDLEMRILAVSDIYDALSAARPYREALPLEKVFEILGKESGEALDADCVEGLKTLKTGVFERAA